MSRLIKYFFLSLSIFLCYSISYGFSLKFWKANKEYKVSEGYGAIGFGKQKEELYGLNSFLVKYGFSKIDDKLNIFSSGGIGIINNRFILAGFGFATSDIYLYNDSLYINYQEGNGEFSVGYKILEYKGYRVFPMFGIVGGTKSMVIQPYNTIATQTLDDVFEKPSFNSIVINNYIAGIFSVYNILSFEVLKEKKSDKINKFITGVALRGGVIYYFSNNWKKIDNINLIPIENDDYKLFVTLEVLIGGASFYK